MKPCSLPLALRMKHQPSSYKCSYAHTTLCITLTIHTPSRVQRSWAREKKVINNKNELVLRATTPDTPTTCKMARGPRITYEQR